MFSDIFAHGAIAVLIVLSVQPQSHDGFSGFYIDSLIGIWINKVFVVKKKFLHEKLFGWGKKDPIYSQVVNDFYDRNILDDKDIDSIRKDSYEL